MQAVYDPHAPPSEPKPAASLLEAVTASRRTASQEDEPTAAAHPDSNSGRLTGPDPSQGTAAGFGSEQEEEQGTLGWGPRRCFPGFSVHCILWLMECVSLSYDAATQSLRVRRLFIAISI